MPGRRNIEMSLHDRQLVVLADGEHVRFVRPGTAGALHTDTAFDSAEAHKQSSDLGSDHPGAAYHSDSTAHHGLAPRHDPHAIAKEHFAKTVAQQLNEAAAKGAFAELVLVAPAHTLAAIRNALDRGTDARIIGTLAKDLVKTPDDELWPHLKDWVKPVHRAK